MKVIHYNIHISGVNISSFMKILQKTQQRHVKVHLGL